MIKLIVNNSYSQITGLSASQEKELRETLSYLEGDHFSSYGPRKRSLMGKKGDFPTGLLPRVQAFLGGLAVILEDKRIIPATGPKVAFTKPIPYPDQIVAVATAVYNHHGTISMPTGTGKSLVISMLIDAFRVKTLVVVPTLEIKRQLMEGLASMFASTKHIHVENIDSAALQKSPTKYDMLIIDEAHHSASRTYQKLNRTKWDGIYYRFFLTATPYRNNKEETLLFESLAGRLIFGLTYKKAIKNKYIVPVEGYYIEVPKQETDAFTWHQVYKELVVNNQERNKRIASLLVTLKQASLPTLALVKEIAHGDILSELTGIPFANGQSEETPELIRRFNKGEIVSLIGTTGVLGEGIDTRPCEYVVVCGLGKAKSAFQQQVGRAVRQYGSKESAKVIIIKDRSHKFLLRHFNAQKRILLEEYGVDTVKLDV